MGMRRRTAEEIIAPPREVEVDLGQSETVGHVYRQRGVSERLPADVIV
jgi:hypothetical protein